MSDLALSTQVLVQTGSSVHLRTAIEVTACPALPSARSNSGWSTPDFDDSGWFPVNISQDPRATLVPFSGEPVRRTERIPVEPRRLDDSTYLLDLGQVIAGRTRLTVIAPAGTELTVDVDARASNRSPMKRWL